MRSLDEAAFGGMDLAFFASGPGASVKFARGAHRQGTVVIDLTAAFRLAKDVPLVIPELDPRALLPAHDGIIACPSPGAVQMALVLAPIHRKAGVKRVVASVYQAVSDAGEGAMDELTGQLTGLLNFQETTCSVFPHRIGFSLVACHFQRSDNFRPGFGREDNFVDIAQRSGFIGIGEPVPVILYSKGFFFGGKVAVENVDGSFGTHDCDFSAGPCEVDIGTNMFA